MSFLPFAGSLAVTAAVVAAVSIPAPSHAANQPFQLAIKDHRFEPSELTVPAGQRFTLVIRNDDPSDEEFESYDLSREELVSAHQSITVYLGPLAAGQYDFFGDYNQKTAQGRLIAR